MIKMKRIIRNAVAWALTVVSLLSIGLLKPFATYTPTVYTNTVLSSFSSLPSDNTYTAVGGFAIGEKGSGANRRNSMFSLVANSSTEASSKFYYYSNISDLSIRKMFYISYAGHANSMTIDSHNIYVTGWVHEDEHLQSYNPYNNIILMIRRTKLAQKNNGDTLLKDNLTTGVENDFCVLHPMKRNNDPATSGSQPYVSYTKAINEITVYGSNGHFLVHYGTLEDKSRIYTTAELIEYNGKTLFVVSTKKSDRFILKNEISLSSGETMSPQDMYYDNNKGLFQSFWIKNSSGVGNKNVILWAKPGTDIGKDTQNIDGYDYTRYTPDRIVFDSLQSTYRKIEFESLAIDLNGRMLIACNANYTNGSSADGIFKLTKSNGSNF